MSSAQTVVLAVGGILTGFAIGSFVCVVIERLPYALDEPDRFGDLYGMRSWREVMGGSSRCDGCHADLTAIDMVPVLSWLVLQGKCRRCGSHISAVHPVVEFLVPAVGVALVLATGWGWRTVPALWLVPVGIAVSVIDLRVLMVPTKIVWPAFGVTLALSGIATLVENEPRWMLGGVIGILGFAGPLALIWFILPQGMGFGDVRLSVLLGWTIGFCGIRGAWSSALFLSVATLAAAALIGVLLGIGSLVRDGRRAKVPFGPSMVIAALLSIALGQVVLKGFRIA